MLFSRRLSAIACFITIAALALTPEIAMSQQNGQGTAAPAGSYLRSCAYLSYDPATQILSANCLTNPNGDYSSSIRTQLNTSYCDPAKDIEGLNGWLQCTARPGAWGNGGAVPAGSYQQSCDHYAVQQVSQNGRTFPQLAAFCKTYNGGNFQQGYLDLSGCSASGDIAWYAQAAINGGHLVCVAAPPSATAPPQHQTTGPASGKAGTCRAGFVWRLADVNDHVCVTPQTRQRVADDNAAAGQFTIARDVHILRSPARCVNGYVWRQATNSDYVCVTPATRAATAADNAAAAARTF